MKRTADSRLRLVLASNFLAGDPEGGGIWSWVLQYPLGLAALGHDVFWLELYERSDNRKRDQLLVEKFFARMGEYGLKERCVLLVAEKGKKSFTLETAQIYGKTRLEVQAYFTSADLLWNLDGSLEQPLLSLFKRCVFIDGDPGMFHLSAVEWDMGQQAHQVFLTVGCKVGDPDCEVPTLGLTWHHFPQFVHLPLWKTVADPGEKAPFTTITQWNWGEIWLRDRSWSIAKREAYLRYVDLPLKTGRPFELAAHIHPRDDTGDRETLESHGWRIVNPLVLCDSPGTYQAYIASGRAGICCPKPIYRELRSGWFSDRSAAYLATGRPVLAEDTGFSDHFPTGQGLLIFRNIEEAAAGVAEIDGDYAHHSRAAREFAEAYLDAGRCLEAMLAACA